VIIFSLHGLFSEPFETLQLLFTLMRSTSLRFFCVPLPVITNPSLIFISFLQWDAVPLFSLSPLRLWYYLTLFTYICLRIGPTLIANSSSTEILVPTPSLFISASFFPLGTTLKNFTVPRVVPARARTRVFSFSVSSQNYSNDW